MLNDVLNLVCCTILTQFIFLIKLFTDYSITKATKNVAFFA